MTLIITIAIVALVSRAATRRIAKDEQVNRRVREVLYA